MVQRGLSEKKGQGGETTKREAHSCACGTTCSVLVIRTKKVRPTRRTDNGNMNKPDVIKE